MGLKHSIQATVAHSIAGPLTRKAEKGLAGIARKVYNRSIFGIRGRKTALAALKKKRTAVQAQRTAFHASAKRTAIVKKWDAAIKSENSKTAIKARATAEKKRRKLHASALVSRTQTKTRGGERPEIVRLLKQKHTAAGRTQRRLQADMVRARRRGNP